MVTSSLTTLNRANITVGSHLAYVCTAQMSYPLGKFISVATRWDMLIAATLLGSVTPIMPPELRNREAQRETHSTDHTQTTARRLWRYLAYPASYRNWGICVVFPLPVSPHNTTHSCSFTASMMTCSSARTGNLRRASCKSQEELQPASKAKSQAEVKRQSPSITLLGPAKPEFTSERCFRTESDLCENMVTKPLCIIGNIVCIISSEMIMITN